MKVDWQALISEVHSRDLRQAWERNWQSIMPFQRWLASSTLATPCVARFLDPGVDACDGRITLDHVKDQPMMGKKAPDDIHHLASICWHHHLDGWATANRPLLREYLKEVSP